MPPSAVPNAIAILLEIKALHGMSAAKVLPQKSLTIPAAKARATIIITTDSTTIPNTRLLRDAPRIFLVLTDFKRTGTRAKKKLMKLMNAMTITKMAMARSVYVVVLLPLLPVLEIVFSKYISSNGNSLILSLDSASFLSSSDSSSPCSFAILLKVFTT